MLNYIFKRTILYRAEWTNSKKMPNFAASNTAFFRPKWLELRSPIVQSKPYFPIRPARPMGFFVPSSVI